MEKLSRYWCYHCKKEFRDCFEDDVICPSCNNNFCEEIDGPESDPQQPQNFAPSTYIDPRAAPPPAPRL